MVAAAVIGGSVLGAGASAYAAKKGAKAQTEAANQANDTQLQMYNQTREDQMPWMKLGKTSLAQLGDMMKPNGQLMKNYGEADPTLKQHNFGMADFNADPGYQFRMSQGLKALQNNAAARGGMASGNAMKALIGYGQGLASDEYSNAYSRFNNNNAINAANYMDRFNRYNANQSNAFNRLSGLAGTGQQTAQSLGSAGQNYATNFGQNVQNAGMARASGYQGQANAFNGLINNGMQIYGMNR